MFSLFTFHEELISHLTTSLTQEMADAAPAIYVHIPEDAKGSLVVIDTLSLKNWDADRSEGVEISFTTHVYDDSASFKRCNDIAMILRAKVENFIPAHISLVNLTIEDQKKNVTPSSRRQHMSMSWRLVGEINTQA